MKKLQKELNLFSKTKEKNGEVTSGTKKYGYDIVDRKYEINQAESQNIINLYKYFIEVNGNLQKTYAYFIKHFKNKGYDALSNYLRETSYIGIYKLYRKDLYLNNYIPRLMDDDLFYSVQNLLVKKEKIIKKSPSFSIFSGIVYCSECNLRMSKKHDNRTKTRVMRYICDNASRKKPGTLVHKCNNRKSIREEYIEQYLLDNLCNELEKIKQKVQITNETPTQENTDKINLLNNKIYKLKDLYLDDLIDKDTYKKDYEKYQKEIDLLKTTQTQKIEKKDFSKVEKILNSDYRNIYNNLSINNKRQFWVHFIDKIYIENGQIKEVTFL